MTKIKKDFFGGKTKRRFERFTETSKNTNTYFAYLHILNATSQPIQLYYNELFKNGKELT